MDIEEALERGFNERVCGIGYDAAWIMGVTHHLFRRNYSGR